MDIVKEIQDNLMIVFVLAFFLFYNLFIKKDPKALFFIFTIFFILLMLRQQYQTGKQKDSRELYNFIKNKEKELSNDFEIMDPKNVRIHKTPRSLKYLRTSPDLLKTVYDLKFINLYDKALYNKFLSYMEYFMKIHYNMMIGYYDYQTYFPIIKDLRFEILNMLKATTFNLPKQSTVLPIDDIDNYMDEKLAFIQARTYKYIKILHHKYGSKRNSTTSYESPYDYDPGSDNYYNMF
jgi:hypothetical protein